MRYCFITGLKDPKKTTKMVRITSHVAETGTWHLLTEQKF